VELKSELLSFVPIRFVMVVEKLASSLRAYESSFKVSKAPGAPLTKLLIDKSTYALVVAS
jgi:hypothetical protein